MTEIFKFLRDVLPLPLILAVVVLIVGAWVMLQTSSNPTFKKTVASVPFLLLLATVLYGLSVYYIFSLKAAKTFPVHAIGIVIDTFGEPVPRTTQSVLFEEVHSLLGEKDYGAETEVRRILEPRLIETTGDAIEICEMHGAKILVWGYRDLRRANSCEDY